MKVYSFNDYKIIAPETMLITISYDKLIMVVVDKEEKEVHCIIEFKDGKLFISNGWNVNYVIDNNKVFLKYNFEKDK